MKMIHAFITSTITFPICITTITMFILSFFLKKKKEKKEIVAYHLTLKLQGTKTISILGNINQRVDAG